MSFQFLSLDIRLLVCVNFDPSGDANPNALPGDEKFRRPPSDKKG
jgi:hypothetical protein